jgi:hypothetical protein
LENTITIGLPPKALSPNRRLNRFRKAEAVAAHRREAWGAAREVLGRRRPRVDSATHAIRAYFKDNHFMDGNLITGLKAARDGITDAGVWRDDSPATLRLVTPIAMAVDCKRPRFELDIEWNVEAE